MGFFFQRQLLDGRWLNDAGRRPLLPFLVFWRGLPPPTHRRVVLRKEVVVAAVVVLVVVGVLPFTWKKLLICIATFQQWAKVLRTRRNRCLCRDLRRLAISDEGGESDAQRETDALHVVGVAGEIIH